MKKLLVLLLGVAVVGTAVSVAASGNDQRKVLRFDVMAPVTEPYTGPTNAIRGVPGGGLPWMLDEVKGELRGDSVKVEVEGLVLARRAPVPANLQGTNPIPAFKAIVSCLSSSGGAPTTVNVATDPVPASATGDAEIEATLALPSPCFAPIVFVTSPTGSWFAVTGR
ncbi:MAG TPA: hypothetical protein VLN26_17705 [Gaiellaceae bacterium]|nr:hypothetical protein [Gaiellaceae bacterium]